MNPNAFSFIQLQHRAQFERGVTLALGGGAFAGGLAAAASGSALRGFFLWAVTAATVFVFAGGVRFERWVIRVMGALFPALAFLLPGVAGKFACAAVGGMLLVLASAWSRGEDGVVAKTRPGVVAYLAAALAGPALLFAGMTVANVLSLAVRNAGLGWPLATVFAGVVTALFFALSALPAYLLLEADPVEAKAQTLLFVLRGELTELCDRMMASYRRCGELLAQLPRDSARGELAQVTSRSVNDALELAREWQEVEAQLEESGESELAAQLESLGKDAAAAKDPLARRQLELAVASLSEEVARLAQLSSRRERVLARLKATCAELDRTRLSLLSLRSARTQTKATELMALSRKLKTLTSLEATRGALESAVATGAELAHIDATVAESAAEAAVRVKI